MILGHQKQWDFLKKLAEKDKFSHAYLFSGQEKLGKKKIALEWISLLFGENILEKSHPDFTLIEPENKEIQIGQIKDLIWKFSLKTYSASFKAAIIDKAHLMNQEAQTSLLKTLEEPKGRTILILITESPEYLFPTIISRVQTVKFYPLKKEEIKNYLKTRGVSGRELEEIPEISLGKPGVAIDIISGSQEIEFFQEKIKELNKISNSTISFRFQYVKEMPEDLPGLKKTLDIWLNYFRNILLFRIGSLKSTTKFGDFEHYSLVKIKNILGLIQTIKFLISTTNVNSRMALETLMLEL